MLYESLRKVGSSLRCSEWGAAAFHADRAATVWANLDDHIKDAMGDDFKHPPTGMGHWGTGAWIAYATWWSIWQEGLPTPTHTIDPVCKEKDRENIGSDWLIAWSRGELRLEHDAKWQEWVRITYDYFADDTGAMAADAAAAD